MRFQRLDRLNTSSIEAVVLFASYEQRSVALARQLAADGFAGRVYTLVCGDALSPDVSDRLAEIRSLLGTIETIEISTKDPIPAVVFGKHLQNHDDLLVDITCFTRGSLFSLLRGWDVGLSSFPQMRVAYSSAESYGPWLTRNFSKPENMLGFGGAPTIKGSRKLICLVGFDGDRAWRVIDHLEPTQVIFCLGTKPSKAEFLKRNKEAIEIINEDPGRVVELPIQDPQATLMELNKLVASLGDESTISIAPFNNKLSCMAVYACWLEHRDMRIWNVVPSSYNYLSYSSGIREPVFFSVLW